MIDSSISICVIHYQVLNDWGNIQFLKFRYFPKYRGVDRDGYFLEKYLKISFGFSVTAEFVERINFRQISHSEIGNI